MTIHQAKGLEFPVVIIPDMDAAPGSSHVAGAHWDSRLGCLVRPPSDEDPPPFDDHGWSLWRMREEIEDWHESLRTLYVACTRAEDYLILSASMTSALTPTSPWMQTLAGRFDLRSGQCLLANVPVRVLGSAVGQEIDALPLPPSERNREAVERGWPEAVPIRGSSQVVFTVEELEECLRGNSAQIPGASIRQHDAEDLSDIQRWPIHSERSALRGRVLHTVLQFADMRDPQIWQSYLRQSAAQMGLPLEETEALEEALRRFSQDFRVRLGEKGQCWFEREFLLEWPRKRPPHGLRHRPVVRGVIDIAWRQGRHWGLLALSSDPLPDGDPIESRPGLIFWVVAAREWLGGWPQSVEMYSLADNTTRSSSHNWQKSDLLTRFHDALSQWQHEAP
jgi:ATP-dependent exoDNAse (exonuclease V) beta subunit